MIAVIVLELIGVYFLVGVVFALFFVSKGCQQVDSDAQESGLGFRIIIFPASAALWPLLLYKWLLIDKKAK